jgi:hypothetical protein
MEAGRTVISDSSPFRSIDLFRRSTTSFLLTVSCLALLNSVVLAADESAIEHREATEINLSQASKGSIDIVLGIG